MKIFEYLLAVLLCVAVVCYAFLFMSGDFTVQLLGAIWLLGQLAVSAAIVVYWHRRVEAPLRDLSCMVTLAEKDRQGKFHEVVSLTELEEALRPLLTSPVEEPQNQSLLAEMSHELKTPLNGVIGFISNLHDTPLNPQQQQFLKIIDSSANSLLHVINQILDYSKINAGSLELETIAFDLRELAQDRVAIAAQLAKVKGVKAYLVFPESAPVIVRGDAARLRQVLDNLLSNAVKFTSTGEICLEIAMTETDSGQLSISFAVRDTGIGMTAETLKKLFQPYRQADASTSRRYGGTGLGLCISHSLVKLMGGTLNVRSSVNAGSTFFFSLLMSPAKPEEQVRLPGPFSIRLPKNELKKCRALLVDDTPTNLFLLETVCQNAGLPYRTASNGQEAVDLCLMHKFDIIFMDIQMPVMDGYTAIRKIRQLPNTAMTHIVALTASAFQEDVDRALGAGSTEFIPKPFEKNQLLLCIADALGIVPEKELLPQEAPGESEDDEAVRHIHEFMREQYQISLGEIKMTLAQTVTDWRPLLDNLRAYVKSGNVEEARAILHKLKGQLASIGLSEHAEMASLLNETLEQTPDDPNILSRLDGMIGSLTRIFRNLEQDVTVV